LFLSGRQVEPLCPIRFYSNYGKVNRREESVSKDVEREKNKENLKEYSSE
jgi:hypothetical protein